MREILVNYADSGKLCSPWPITLWQYVQNCYFYVLLIFVT